MSYFLNCLNNYANFNGRARRKEFWMFALFYYIFTFIAILLDRLFGTVISVGETSMGIITSLVALAFMLPSIAVTVRRLHDIDKSGWWYFISAIPIAGPIWMFILLCTDGTPGKNRYGYDPKGRGANIVPDIGGGGNNNVDPPML